MSAIVGKLAWLLVGPSNALLLLLGLGLLLAALGWRLGRWLAGTAFLLLAVVVLVPVGEWLREPLEKRFAIPDPPPAHVDGIIVLGGGVDTRASHAWHQPALGPTAERFTALIELSRRWPQARLAFSGGIAPLSDGPITEAAVLKDFYDRLGFDSRRITFEDRSRTTHENARFSRELLQPRPGEVWLLVTSAAHMPRAVGSFRAVGFPVVPWPVDYRTDPLHGMRLRITTSERLTELDEAGYEWLGLAWYRALGWTDRLLPGPGDAAS
jgi:uncharacterized SAM-binding protein YcdF (DUF218 family)